MSERLFRFLVRLYPEAIRRHHEDEMLALMRFRRGRARGLGIAGLWLVLLLDTLRALPAAYLDELRGSHPSHPPRVVDDVRHALRSLRHRPASSLAVVSCFALGIGGITAALSFYYGILVRPLPFDEPDRLAVLFTTAPGFTRASPSYADFAAWREQAHAFSPMAAYSSAATTVPSREGPERMDGCAITYGFFQVLGEHPVLGRGPTEDEDRPGAPATVVLSHALWREHFASDPAALGQSLLMDGEPYVVIGVMPAGFDFPAGARFWTPMRRSATPGAGAGVVRAAIGRLAPGWSITDARTEMQGVAHRLQEADPAGHAEREIAVRPLTDDLLHGWEQPVSGFLLVTALLFLLACGNVAHLLLTQSALRSREMVLRSALGAGRGNLLLQLVAEGLVLAVLGGAVGLGLGVLGRDLYLHSLPAAPPAYLSFGLGGPLVVVLVGGTIVAGIATGLLPALDTFRRDLLAALRAGDQPWSRVARGRLTQPVLIGLQTALALVVLVGAATAARSSIRLNRVPLGFDAHDVMTMRIALPPDEREDQTRQRLLFERVRDRIASLPGVADAAVVSNLPVGGMAAGTSLYVEHTEPPAAGHEPWVINKVAQPGYFGVMRIPLVAGRGFTGSDGAPGQPPVVIVNQSFADRYWPGESALGKRVKYGAPESSWPWMEVVGVVGDVRHFGRSQPVELGIYEPFPQSPWWRMFLTVRVDGNPPSTAGALRQAIRQVSPGAAVYDVRSMSAVVYADQWRSVVYTRLLAVFSFLALTLAALGMFGVVAFSTARRSREFGVRIALGAHRISILGSAGRGLATPVGAGLVGGLLLCAALAPLTTDLFYDSHGLDLVVAASSVVSLSVVAIVATYLPARRALRVDPARTLRAE